MTPGKPYRPSNGTEGEIFCAKWCDNCTKDEAHREDADSGDGCHILAASLAFSIRDAAYPKEWVYDDADQPKCTAFERYLTRADRLYLEWKASQ